MSFIEELFYMDFDFYTKNFKEKRDLYLYYLEGEYIYYFYQVEGDLEWLITYKKTLERYINRFKNDLLDDIYEENDYIKISALILHKEYVVKEILKENQNLKQINDNLNSNNVNVCNI